MYPYYEYYPEKKTLEDILRLEQTNNMVLFSDWKNIWFIIDTCLHCFLWRMFL